MLYILLQHLSAFKPLLMPETQDSGITFHQRCCSPFSPRPAQIHTHSRLGCITAAAAASLRVAAASLRAAAAAAHRHCLLPQTPLGCTISLRLEGAPRLPRRPRGSLPFLPIPSQFHPNPREIPAGDPRPAAGDRQPEAAPPVTPPSPGEPRLASGFALPTNLPPPPPATLRF